MKSTFFFITLLIALGVASANLKFSENINQNSEDVTRSIITNVLEHLLREFFSNLTNIQDVPLLPLGPYGNLTDVNVYLTNTVVYDIIAGTGNNIKNTTITFEEITLTGQYDLALTISSGPVEISGDGNFFVNLQDVKFITGLNIRINETSWLAVTGFPNFDLTVEKSRVLFENLMGGGATGELINSIISDELPKLIQFFAAKYIEEDGDVLADRYLNPFINCVKDHITNPGVCF